MVGASASIAFAFALAALMQSLAIADDSTPTGQKILDIVAANTVEAHAGRMTSSVDNSTGLAPEAASTLAAAGSAVSGVIGTVVNTTSELVSNITASSPAPAKSVSKGAAKAPSAYWFGTDGGDLFLSSDGTWSYSDSKYAAPLAIVLLLLLLAGVGLFFVVRRRRAAAARNYYGLKEAELGSTHRTV